MSKFKAFLKGNVNRLRTKKVVVSDAFKDENGNIIPFVIRNLDSAEEKRIRKECMTSVNEVTGLKQLDQSAYEDKITVACVVEPDLKNAELQDSYGVIGENELLNAMLLTGEYTTLQRKITEFNGFKTFTDKVEEAKN